MAEPALRRTDIDGSKFYDHPTNTDVRYDSVTSVLTTMSKPNLVFWSANLAAARAVDNVPKILTAVLVPDCGRANARKEPLGCRECLACVQRWIALYHVGEKERRAREGTAAHDILETWTKTGQWIYRPVMTGDPDVDQYVPTHETMAPYLKALQDFVTDFGLAPEDWIVCECTVYNHTHRYAGTLDGIVDIWPRTERSAEFWARVARAGGVPDGQPVRVVVDCKSREGEGPEFYDEQPLQLDPYRFAETMLPKLAAPEMERPMLATDGAAILQVRPDGYTFRPVRTTGDEFKAFLGLLDAYRWRQQWGEKATQVGTFPLPEGWTNPHKVPPVRKRAAARKAAPAPAAPAATAAAPAVTATAVKAPPAKKAAVRQRGAIMDSLTGGIKHTSPGVRYDDGTEPPF